MVYFVIIVMAIILDRIVKWGISNAMVPGQTIPVIENIFHITYVRNTGAAFSMMQGQTIILVGLPVVVMVVAVVLLIVKRKFWHPLLCTGISMICAGGTGNLIDRASVGYVVDMFDFRVFPVFNVADIFVCAGCGAILIYVMMIEGRKEKKQN